MALDAPTAAKQAGALLEALDKSLDPRQGSIGRLRRYLAGDHDLPYMPVGAKREYRMLAERSRTNWLPLVVDTFAQSLFVDGYRPAKTADNADAWGAWQANGLDARQGIAHTSALSYGIGYALVLPGKPRAVIRPLPATRALALYADPDDEWPVFGIVTDGSSTEGDRFLRFYDATHEWTLRKRQGSDECEVIGDPSEHGLGVCPIVRFRDRLDGEAVGVIAPLLTIQDRVNEAVFALHIALQYASFRQRWATGLAIPTDEAPWFDPQTQEPTHTDTGVANPNLGKPIEAFEAAVDRVWVSDSPDAKFGDFAQTDVSGHLATYDSAVKTLAAVGQISPHVLLGDLVNLSAEALAATEQSTMRRSEGFATIFGESWEQALRLAAKAEGNADGADDTESEVRWRDREARSLAATVDALGKIATMLQVPAEGLWDRIPGVTDGDVERWKTLAGKSNGLAAIAEALSRQASPASVPAVPAAPTPPVQPGA